MDLGEELNALYTDVLHNRCIFTVKLSKLICHAPKLGIIFDTHYTLRDIVLHRANGAHELQPNPCTIWLVLPFQTIGCVCHALNRMIGQRDFL